MFDGMPLAEPAEEASRNTVRRVIPFAGATTLVLLAIAIRFFGSDYAYRAMTTYWAGFTPFRIPFVDTDMVLSALQCTREGVDVYVTNPCDLQARVYDYSPFWLILSVFPVTAGWLAAVGLAMVSVFLLSLLLLPVGRGWRETALILLAACSSASAYAVERGNNELLIFALAAIIATLACRSRHLRWIGYALALIAGLLKYYPMSLLALAVRERPAMFWTVVAGSAAAIALFVAVDGHDLSRALKLIPAGDIFSDTFGSAMVAQAFQRMFGWSDLARHALQSAMAGAVVLTAIHTGMRDDMRRDVARLTEQERNFLLVGGLLTIGCFFTAHNAGYRAIQLLLVVPTLTALFRTGGHRRAYGWTVATAIGAMWAQGWLALGVRMRDILRLPAREFDMLIWFAREACWWWTTAILAALVTALLLRSTMAQSLFPTRTARPA